MTEIIIRSARPNEFEFDLPSLASRAYQDRFFNKETIIKNGKRILESEKITLSIDEKFEEFSGSLSVPFSCLRPKETGAGQSFESFRKYWEEKKCDKDFRVFVAEAEGKIIGFVKGTFTNINLTEDFPECKFAETENILSLGSLYIDPNFRAKGVGTKLVQEYVSEMLKERPDCRGMVTDCYWRNNSQYFFSKLGGESAGFCNIPDRYLDEQLQTRVQNITGEVMYWNRQALNYLIKTYQIETKKPLEVGSKYTRNTPLYSVMVAANGNMLEFARILADNNFNNTKTICR